MKNVYVVAILILAIIAPGCARWRNNVASKGGIIGSYSGDYIVRNDSGGRIMDVWVLRDVMIQSEFEGTGWLFRDKDGNVINLGGDVKVIRVKNKDVLYRYKEYHAEFETNTYQELYGKLLGEECEVYERLRKGVK
jgi:hypothetical protein